MSQLSKLIALWNCFGVWRARRKYRQVVRMAARAELLNAEADRLMKRHGEDPQGRLALGDD